MEVTDKLIESIEEGCKCFGYQFEADQIEAVLLVLKNILIQRSGIDWATAGRRFSMGYSEIYSTDRVKKEVFIEWRGQGSWGVFISGLCLGKDGQWYDEPSPSNRTDEYLALCRYSTKEEARQAFIDHEQQFNGVKQPLYYKYIHSD